MKSVSFGLFFFVVVICNLDLASCQYGFNQPAVAQQSYTQTTYQQPNGASKTVITETIQQPGMAQPVVPNTAGYNNFGSGSGYGYGKKKRNADGQPPSNPSDPSSPDKKKRSISHRFLTNLNL